VHGDQKLASKNLSCAESSSLKKRSKKKKKNKVQSPSGLPPPCPREGALRLDQAGWCLSLTRCNAGPLLQCPCTSVPAAKRTDEWTPGTVRPLIAHALNGDNSADCTALHPWCPCSCLSVAMYIRHALFQEHAARSA